MTNEQHDRILLLIAKEMQRVLDFNDPMCPEEFDFLLQELIRKKILDYSFDDEEDDWMYFLSEPALKMFEGMEEHPDESLTLVARVMINS